MQIPEYYREHREVAEKFVEEYTPLILAGKINLSIPAFNYMPSNELLFELAELLGKKNYISKSTMALYTLKDSTTIGSWSNSYEKYNCYAYSIGKTSWRQPDGSSGTYDLTKTISAMADDVLVDLSRQGYWGYKTTTKPAKLPDKYFRLICIRKNTSNIDYHFMKKYSSVDSWAHKPGGTQPLKWKYSSPGTKAWTNECVYKGIAYSPTIEYNSTIYYILYKSKNDPGVQLKGLSVKQIESMIQE